MRRNGFELKMQDRYSHFLAADSEVEMEDWVSTLKQALQSATEAVPDKRNGAEPLDFNTGQLLFLRSQKNKQTKKLPNRVLKSELPLADCLFRKEGRPFSCFSWP